MERDQTRNEIIIQIWELRMRVYIWRFIFGAFSSPEKVEEFNKYFTNRILFEFKKAYETEILIELRAILDNRKDVISIYKLIEPDKLIKFDTLYKDIKKYTNKIIAHRDENRSYTYKFIDVINTIDELQKVLENDKTDETVIWESEDLIKDELNKFYEKIKKINLLES